MQLRPRRRQPQVQAVAQLRVHQQVVVDVAAAEQVLQQARAAVVPRVKLREVLVVDVAAVLVQARALVLAVVQALAVAAVEVAAVALRLCRPLVRKDVEVFWLRGTPSLRKRRGADLPDPVQVLMPAVRLQLQETLCLRMSRIVCLRLKPIRANRFWTWQPEWQTLALP